MWRGSRAHIFRNNDINITTGPGAGSSHLFFDFHDRREDAASRQSQQNDDIWVMDTFWMIVILLLFIDAGLIDFYLKNALILLECCTFLS